MGYKRVPHLIRQVYSDPKSYRLTNFYRICSGEDFMDEMEDCFSVTENEWKKYHPSRSPPSEWCEGKQFKAEGKTNGRFSSFFRKLEGRIGAATLHIHRAVQPVSEYPYNQVSSPFLTSVKNTFSAWKGDMKNSLSDPAAQSSFANTVYHVNGQT